MITMRTRQRQVRHPRPRHEQSGLILIRQSQWHDATALRRLADLDSRDLPSGSFLLAEVSDELVAAVPLDPAETSISDPFKPTADIVALLEMHACQLRGQGREVAA
jgi:hypothetical protein